MGPPTCAQACAPVTCLRLWCICVFTGLCCIFIAGVLFDVCCNRPGDLPGLPGLCVLRAGEVCAGVPRAAVAAVCGGVERTGGRWGHAGRVIWADCTGGCMICQQLLAEHRPMCASVAIEGAGPSNPPKCDPPAA